MATNNSKTNCVINGVKYYRIVAELPRGPKGERRQKPFYGTGITDAKAKRDAYLAALDAGLDLSFAKMTVGAAMKSWLFEVKLMDSSIKSTTFERYEGIFRHSIEGSKIAAMLVPAVKSIDVQRHLNDLAKKGLGYNPLKSSLKLLRMFYIYATSEGYTLKDPCSKNVKIPGVKPTKEVVETFTDEEVTLLKAKLTGHRLRFLILLSLGTGIRKGEALALTYADIHDNQVYITKSLATPTLTDMEGKRTRTTEIWTPKSQSSNRAIPFPKELEKELNAHDLAQMKERMKNGIGGKSEYIFTSESGQLYDPTNVYVAYGRLLKKAGIAHKKFHALRHTYATKLVRANVPLPVVKDLMGHSKIDMTMIYVHVSEEDKTRAVQDNLNEMFK